MGQIADSSLTVKRSFQLPSGSRPACFGLVKLVLLKTNIKTFNIHAADVDMAAVQHVEAAADKDFFLTHKQMNLKFTARAQ
jgi:hypothetical protein